MRNPLATGTRAVDIDALRALAELERQAAMQPPPADRMNYLSNQPPMQQRQAVPLPPSNTHNSKIQMLGGSSTPETVNHLARQPAPQRYKEPSKFVNTLGRIGDAMAAMGGKKGVYEPYMQERRFKNALADWRANPNDPGAVDRFVNVGGEDALGLVMKGEEAERARQKSTLDLSAGRLKLLRDANRGAIESIGSVSDQEGWDQALDQAEALYGQFGIDVRAHLPAAYPGPDGVRALMLDAMDLDDRLAAMDRRDRLDWDMEDDRIDNERADRNTSSLITRRAQPPAPRRAAAPRAPSTSNIVAGVLAKVRDGVKLTPGETEIYTRYRDGTRGRGGRAASGGAAPAAGPQQYKEGDIYRNSKGKEVILRNGRWVPHR